YRHPTRNSLSQPSHSDSPLNPQATMPKMFKHLPYKLFRGFMQDRFTSQQLIALTGITPRQLQWWDERGVVKPEREGHRRLYSMGDLAEVAVICELRRRGFPLPRVRKVMHLVQRECGKRVAATVRGANGVHLLT